MPLDMPRPPAPALDEALAPTRELRELGRRLKAWREHADLTLRDVSLRTGQSENYYGMIERGQRNPSETMLEKVCDLLALSPADRDEAFRLYGVGFVRDTARRALRKLSARTQRLVGSLDVLAASRSEEKRERVAEAHPLRDLHREVQRLAAQVSELQERPAAAVEDAVEPLSVEAVAAVRKRLGARAADTVVDVLREIRARPVTPRAATAGPSRRKNARSRGAS